MQLSTQHTITRFSSSARRGGWCALVCLLLVVGMAPAQAQEAGCGRSLALPAGVSRQSVVVGDATRTYRLYVPTLAANAGPVPLVMSFHGFASTANQQARWSGWDALAEREGFIVAYPQGSGFPPRWYNGINEFTRDDDLRDVAFVTAVLDALTATGCVDASRVYATGFSAGGGMAYRLACDLSARITAIGTVSGAYADIPGGCQTTRPVPVITFHGDADPVVPYEGRGSLPKISRWVADWADRNQCAAEAEALVTPADVVGLRYTRCADAADVVFYTLIGGGHTWPGQAAEVSAFLVGAVNRSLDATTTMWEFFSTRPRLSD